ncbi:unnamed protein product, partial [Meganyctiphanes norvegica]
EVAVSHGRQVRVESRVSEARSALHEARKRQQRLHTAVATLDNRLHKEQQQRDDAAKYADHLHTSMQARLKELESETSQKECEVSRLREERENSEGKLLEMSHERQLLESQVEEARDARDKMRHETGAQGELHAMKTEINRMQARWRTLEATQRELSGRLEQSVTVEGALRTRTLASVEKIRRDPNSAKATRNMQEDILKRKIARNKKILQEVKEDTEKALTEHNQLEGEVHRKERLYAQNVRLLQHAAQHLQEKLTNKQE